MRVSKAAERRDWHALPNTLVWEDHLLSCKPTSRELGSDQRLEPQYSALREALATGLGDPDDIRLDDCSTQRNPNETGRKQARAIPAVAGESTASGHGFVLTLEEGGSLRPVGRVGFGE